MTPITCWQNVGAFKGRIVRFQSDIYYYNRGMLENMPHYAIVSKSSCMWQGGRQGYEMVVVLESDLVGGITAVVNDRLSFGYLEMERITSIELKEISDKINSDQFRFCYMEKQESLKHLQLYEEERISETDKSFY